MRGFASIILLIGVLIIVTTVAGGTYYFITRTNKTIAVKNNPQPALEQKSTGNKLSPKPQSNALSKLGEEQILTDLPPNSEILDRLEDKGSEGLGEVLADPTQPSRIELTIGSKLSRKELIDFYNSKLPSLGWEEPPENLLNESGFLPAKNDEHCRVRKNVKKTYCELYFVKGGAVSRIAILVYIQSTTDDPFLYREMSNLHPANESYDSIDINKYPSRADIIMWD